MQNKLVPVICLGILLLSALACDQSGEVSPSATVPPTATPLPTEEDWQLWVDQNQPPAPKINMEVPAEWATHKVPFRLTGTGDTSEVFVNGSSIIVSSGSLTGTLNVAEGINTIRAEASLVSCPEDPLLREFGCAHSHSSVQREILVDTLPPNLSYQVEPQGSRFRIWGSVNDGDGVGPEELRFFQGSTMRRINVSQTSFDFQVPYAELGDFLEIRVSDDLGNSNLHSVPVVWPARWVLYDAQDNQLAYRLNRDFHPFSFETSGLKSIFGWGGGTYWVKYDEAGNAVDTLLGTNDTGALVLGGLGLGVLGGILLVVWVKFFAPVNRVLREMSGAFEMAEQRMKEHRALLGQRSSKPALEDLGIGDISVEEVNDIFLDVVERPPSNRIELANFLDRNKRFVASALKRRRRQDG